MLKWALCKRPPWSACSSRVSVRTYLTMSPKSKTSKQAQLGHYSSHLMVLNVDNATAAPSVLLSSDKERFLFNAGEGIQRHFSQHKQKTSKVTSIFATHVSTDTLAGVTGMLLSQDNPGGDAGKSGGGSVHASVYGPPGLQQYLDAINMYAINFVPSINEFGELCGFCNTTLGLLFLVEEVQGAHAVPQQGTPGCSLSVCGDRITVTSVLLTAAPDSQQAEQSKQVEQEAATTDEPAVKRPRHDTAASTGTEGPRLPRSGAEGGMASVHSTGAQLQSVACYVCQLASVPGKFDPHRAAQLGVPKGPLYGELQRGNSVTAVNGQVIHPHQVMSSPSVPGPCCLIVDCPNLSFLRELQASSELQQVQQEAQQQQQQQQASSAAQPTACGGAAQLTSCSEQSPVPKCFVLVHLGPAAVTSSKEYMAWCDGFGPATQHLFVSRESQHSCTTRSAAQLQAQMNVVEPEVFSLQDTKATPQQQDACEERTLKKAGAQDHAAGSWAAADAASSAKLAAVDGVIFGLTPTNTRGLCFKEALTQAPDWSAVQAEVREQHPQVMQLLQEYVEAKAAVLQEQQQKPDPRLQGITRNTCALTPLGTCSACPTKHRNVSSYYLDLFDRGGLLMDCGEDALGQMERRFGRADADRRVLQLHAVWISHMHADHHGGLYPLLLHRQALIQQQLHRARHPGDAAQAPKGSDTRDFKDQGSKIKPLLIMGPFPLFRVLCQYSKVLPLHFTFLPNHSFQPTARQPPEEALAAYEAVKAAAGLSELRPFPVQHISHSSGLEVQGQGGWKVVFSGDTRPCQSVIDAAQDATLLVHEATFEDDMVEDAIAKRHSTTAEALRVAAEAGAYRTLLTHFSTRYPRIPVMKPPARAAVEGEGSEAVSTDCSSSGSNLAALGSVLVAFDMMTINLADLAWMPKMLPVLDALCQEVKGVNAADDGAAETAH